MFRSIFTIRQNSTFNSKHSIKNNISRISTYLIRYRQIRQKRRTSIVRIQFHQKNRTITVRQRTIRSIRVRRLTVRITSRNLVNFNRQFRRYVLEDFRPLILNSTNKVSPTFTIQQNCTSKRILRHTTRTSRQVTFRVQRRRGKVMIISVLTSSIMNSITILNRQSLSFTTRIRSLS